MDAKLECPKLRYIVAQFAQCMASSCHSGWEHQHAAINVHTVRKELSSQQYKGSASIHVHAVHDLANELNLPAS